MKKIIATTLAAVIFNIFSPVAPLAHAGSIENSLTQIMAQDATAARIQQLLIVKQQLEQGNKKGLLEALTKAALNQSGQGDISTVATAINTVTAVNAVKDGNSSQVAKDEIRKQVEKNIMDKVAPYQKELAIIAGLLYNQTLTPQVISDSNSLTGAPENYKRLLNMTATAYAPGTLDNGKWDTLTYMGGTVRHGVVAVDPRVIPMGSKLWVEGYGEAIAEDQGSAIKGNRIDLAFNDRKEALDYGIKNVKIYVLN